VTNADPRGRRLGGIVQLKEQHVLERAFELARSGKYHSTTDLLRALSAEGYAKTDPHLVSKSVRLQLRRLCAGARIEANSATASTPPAGD